MRTLRRYPTLLALMFWLGGFTFYASIVVPIGTEVLGSPLEQGFITRRVTQSLNGSAAVALTVLLVEVILTADPSRRRRWLRIGLWALMALAQVILFWLHVYLDSMLEVERATVLNRAAFRPAHRIYLWTHTVQWAIGLLYIALMLRAWQAEDGSRRGMMEEGG